MIPHGVPISVAAKAIDDSGADTTGVAVQQS
jgi:hypothetical protein